jgi:hypothetical protein
MTTSPEANKASATAWQARRATGWLALAAGLLIGMTRTGAAAEMIQSPVFASVSQPAGAGQAEPETSAATTAPASPMLPPAGTVGFGWG